MKLYQICSYMIQYNIDIVCMQEVRRSTSEHYFTEEGFKIILSGGSGSGPEWAGVGFVVSPRLANHIAGFCQVSSRLAYIKLKIAGGTAVMFNAYAPHNLKLIEDRFEFYEQLSTHFEKVSTNGPKIILGDFNARIGSKRLGEDEVVGDFGFGREAVHKVEVPNRDLLLEFCLSHQMVVSNTFFDKPLENKVTYHEPGVSPNSPITLQGFSVLDLVLVPKEWLPSVQDCSSDRNIAFASHHFPVTANLRLSLQAPQVNKHRKIDWGVLRDGDTRSAFAKHVLNECGDGSKSSCWSQHCEAVAAIARKTLADVAQKPRKPWISEATLSLLEQLRAARQSNDWDSEKALRKQVRKAARQDRSKWLENLAASGDWSCIAKLRKGKQKNQGRLRDASGDLVSSDLRAETFATHLETVQWRVRPVTLVPDTRPALHEALNVDCQPFALNELRKAIAKMSSGKATVDKDIPVECFKALAQEGDQYLQWLLSICNECWLTKAVPSEWSTASVALIYKKGDPSSCDNYRPICLLSIAYKLFAWMLKERLLAAGADAALWSSQFGFRPGRSTEDAIFIARRKIELARAQRNGKVSLLALDWRKAFDSIHVSSLVDALRRFGLPQQFLEMMSSLLSSRHFSVSECSCTSTLHRQDSGISQGCTLSPLLFIIVMTVLMHDAVQLLGTEARSAYDRGDLADLVYADDTLLVGVADRHLNEFLAAVQQTGMHYGLELHADKFQLLSTDAHARVTMPGGAPIPVLPKMEYLGALLTTDGCNSHELNRRIGAAKADFLSIQKVWSHSSLTWKRKLYVFSALIESKLLYSLSSMCLKKADLRRLDGFQNRCIRKIIGVKPAFISRVSNVEVLAKAGHRAASEIWKKRRLQLFGRVLRSPASSLMRQVCFIDSTFFPATDRYVRRIGRPSKEWVRESLGDICDLFGSMEAASRHCQNKELWNKALQTKLGF